MPSQPSASSLHVNRLLTDMSVKWLQDPGKFIATRVFPAINVQKKSDSFATFGQADFFRDEMAVRASGAESAGGGYSVSTSSYNCEKYAFHKDVSDDERANADNPVFQPDADATQYLVQKRLLKQDTLWVSNFFTTGKWTGSTTATDLVGGTDFTAWDDAASDPIGDVKKQMAYVESQTGILPNVLVLNRQGWNALENHPDLVDRLKYTSSGSVSTAMVANLMGLDRIEIAASVKNAAAEGLAGSYSYIAGKHALLTYTPSAPALNQPVSGLTFQWTGLLGSNNGQTISQFRLERNKADRFEIEASFDMKIVSAALGVFFSGVCS